MGKFSTLENIVNDPNFKAGYSLAPDSNNYLVSRYALTDGKISVKDNTNAGQKDYTKIKDEYKNARTNKLYDHVADRLIKKLAWYLGGDYSPFSAKIKDYKSAGDKVEAIIEPAPGILEGLLYLGKNKGNFGREIKVTVNKADGKVTIDYIAKESMPKAVLLHDMNRLYKGLTSVSEYFVRNARAAPPAAPPAPAPTPAPGAPAPPGAPVPGPAPGGGAPPGPRAPDTPAPPEEPETPEVPAPDNPAPPTPEQPNTPPGNPRGPRAPGNPGNPGPNTPLRELPAWADLPEPLRAQITQEYNTQVPHSPEEYYRLLVAQRQPNPAPA